MIRLNQQIQQVCLSVDRACVRASGLGSDGSLGDEAVSAEHDLVSAANLQQLTS